MKYAIVESGGKQFRAVEGGTIEVDRLPVESGAKVKLEQVLLMADGDNITIGTPLVKDIPVWTTVVEHFKGPKVNIFNYSPKKRIRVKIGHRQNYTRLFVEQIGGSELVKKEPVKVEKAVEVKSETLSSKGKTSPKAKAETASPKGKTEKPASRGKSGTTKAKPKAETISPKGKKPAAKATTKQSAKKTKPASRGKAGSTSRGKAGSTSRGKAGSTKAEPKSSLKGKKPAPKKPAAK
jgi:large subunit ribosomal protein L21